MADPRISIDRPGSLVIGSGLVVIGVASLVDTWVGGRIDWSRALPVVLLVAGVTTAGLMIARWRRR